MAEKVFTAPVARIKVKDEEGKLQTIGKMRTIRVSETYRRGRVIGIGQITPSELPLLEFSGSLTCSHYTINFKTHYLKKLAINREVDNVVNFVNTTLLREEGVELYLERREAGTENNGIITPVWKEFAVIRNLFITQDGFDLSENAISGHDSSFEYTEPVTYMQVE